MELRNTWEIKRHGEKWVSIPASLVEMYEGKPFLKIRASHHCIVKLVLGDNFPKNASIASSKELAKLLVARNAVAAGKDDSAAAAASAPKEELFSAAEDHSEGQKEEEQSEEEPEQTRNNRKVVVPAGDYIVEVNVGGTAVEMLMKGRRPASSDLAVHMIPGNLEAVFECLSKDAKHSVASTKRKYTRKEDD